MQIPQGATIVSAKVTFHASSSQSGTVAKIKIQGNDIDTAVNPTSAAEFNALVKTTAFVDWNPPAWTVVNYYDSDDITEIIQEIVDREGWESGNDLILLYLDNSSDSGANRQAYSAGGTTRETLTVVYTTV